MTDYYRAGPEPLSHYEVSQAIDIYKWKNAEPGVISMATGYVLAPLNWAIQKIIPEKAIMGALDLANRGAKQMTDSRDLLQETNVSTFQELYELPIERSDVLANNVQNWAIALGTAEGAATGFFGVFGIPADIPAIITLALRTIHKLGLCYGYEMESEEDFQFTYAILSSASANSLEEKIAALATLRSFQMVLIRQTWKKMAQTAAQRTMGKEGALITLRTLARQLGINITKRRALAAIPAIGALVGGGVNAWYMKDIGWAARRAFQERKLLDQGKIIDIPISKNS
ncbi:MAG: EcsC family protein [Desulfomonilaceae bacterium]